MRTWVAVATAALLAVPAAGAELFFYRDEGGRVVFVEDMERLPAEDPEEEALDLDSLDPGQRAAIVELAEQSARETARIQEGIRDAAPGMFVIEATWRSDAREPGTTHYDGEVRGGRGGGGEIVRMVCDMLDASGALVRRDFGFVDPGRWLPPGTGVTFALSTGDEAGTIRTIRCGLGE